MSRFLYFLLYTICLLSNRLTAQPFGANNAKWHYDVINFWPPVSSNPVILQADSTYILGGYQVLNINVNPQAACFWNNSFQIRESNDSVYYYIPGINQFAMLYDYNAAIGDTHMIRGLTNIGTDTSIVKVVTDTAWMLINNQWKRSYRLEPLFDYFDFGGLIIEDIGSVVYPFPQWGFCDPVVQPLRCYEDSILGFVSFQFPWPWACDTILYLGLQDIETTQVFVSPNPFINEINISLAFGNLIDQVRIFDLMGHEVSEITYQEISGSNSMKLNLEYLRSGMYFLELSGKSGRQTQRIIKQ